MANLDQSGAGQTTKHHEQLRRLDQMLNDGLED